MRLEKSCTLLAGGSYPPMAADKCPPQTIGHRAPAAGHGDYKGGRNRDTFLGQHHGNLGGGGGVSHSNNNNRDNTLMRQHVGRSNNPGGGGHPRLADTTLRHNRDCSGGPRDTSSGDRDGGGGGSRSLTRGLRQLTLSRQKGETYGFHLKGGKEHGTGFFISHVEKDSVAQRRGIKAGDQLLEVGGRSVSGLQHRQVADTIAATLSISILLRDAGIIPVKERSGDPLTWVMVDGVPTQAGRGPVPKWGEAGDSPHNTNGDHRIYRVVIPAAGKASLGFSITHDPSTRNGTFVATVKKAGPAYVAGLRPHDQILACNGRDLASIDHNQAVMEMKQQSQLVLEVRRLVSSARPDAVAGESSGYNSSASSTTGDRTPPLMLGGIRRGRRPPQQEHITTRLSAVSSRLEEREQELHTIDGEWASAEADQKRQVLHYTSPPPHHHHHRMHKQNLVRKGHVMSRSASDLLDSTQYEDSNEHRQSPYLTSAINPNSVGGHPIPQGGGMRSAHSTNNLLTYNSCSNKGRSYIRSSSCTSDEESNTVYSKSNSSTINNNNKRHNSSDLSHCSSTKNTHQQQYNSSGNSNRAAGGHKIALQMSSGSHVNNIVVNSSRFRDEKDAVCRLDQLSCPSESDASSAVAVAGADARRVCARQEVQEEKQVEQQLQRIQEQKRQLQEQEERLVREKSRFEAQRRGTVQRTLSAPVVPLGPLIIPCLGDQHPTTNNNNNLQDIDVDDNDESATTATTTCDSDSNHHHNYHHHRLDNFSNSHLLHSPSFPQRNNFSRSPSPTDKPHNNNNHSSFSSSSSSSTCYRSTRSPSRSPPSPSPSSASGRHTSRIHIKSSPPAPPPRHTTTTLTRHHHTRSRHHSSCSCCHSCNCHNNSGNISRPSKHSSSSLTRYENNSSCSCCGPANSNHHSTHNKQQQKQHCLHCRHHSPPSSPSSSSGISCSSSNPQHSFQSSRRRSKSFDELSRSSNEDAAAALWDDVRHYHHNQHHHHHHHHNSSANINTAHHNNITEQQHQLNSCTKSRCSKASASVGAGVIPPPPLPSSSDQRSLNRNNNSNSMSTALGGPPVPPPLPSLHVPPSNKPDFASALTQALQHRKIENTNSSSDDRDQAQAYQEKIDAYKKEKAGAKGGDSVMHEKLMEEFKMKHRQMFTSEDNSSSSSSGSSPVSSEEASVQTERTPETFTILKSELAAINAPPGTKTNVGTRFQRTTVALVANNKNSVDKSIISNNSSVVNKKPLEESKSHNTLGAPFSSKIVMRSQSINNQKNVPEKRHTVHLSSLLEKESDGNDSALQYWKKKLNAVAKPVDNNNTTTNNTITLPTAISFTTARIIEDSTANGDCNDVLIDEKQSETITVNPEQLSASDLIKTYNFTASQKKIEEKNTGSYPNKSKAVKGKAPQPAVATSNKIARPAHHGGIVPSTNNSRPPARLVKTQVSHKKVPPPPPPPPSRLEQQNAPHVHSSSVLISSRPNNTNDLTSTKSDSHYSPISIAVGGGHSASSPSHYSSMEINDCSANLDQFCPIAAPPISDISFANISPSELIIPRPPSPLLYSSSTEIPKGVPPPPASHSWDERTREDRSVIHITHSSSGDGGDQDYQNRFIGDDNSSSKFKAMFTDGGHQKQGSAKPLVSIDSYGSNTNRAPQKIDFLSGGGDGGGYDGFKRTEVVVEHDSSRSVEGDDATKAHVQSEFTSVQNHSKDRQRRDSDTSSSSSDTDKG